ncbi:high-potential iron-sulfur protein [Cupriavidus sp. USMAHM13]|uniref:high-potential iron-sulfur protein n=1 Tax=Cupriavidus sp. USMAHM13 TaxID=1389192 RepID=UPI0009F660CA
MSWRDSDALAAEPRCTCEFSQGMAGDAWGPCAVSGGKQVSANGRCNSCTKQA